MMISTVATMTRTAGRSMFTPASPATISARCVRLIRSTSAWVRKMWAKRRAQLFALEDRADDAGDFVVGQPVAHRLEGLDAGLAQVHVGQHAAELLGDRMAGNSSTACLRALRNVEPASISSVSRSSRNGMRRLICRSRDVARLASRRRRNQAVTHHGQHGQHEPAAAEPGEEQVDVDRREEQGDQLQLAEILLRQPEPRQAGRLDLAVDRRQAVAEHAAVEPGQQLNDRLEEPVEQVDPPQLVDAADVVPPFERPAEGPRFAARRRSTRRPTADRQPHHQRRPATCSRPGVGRQVRRGSEQIGRGIIAYGVHASLNIRIQDHPRPQVRHHVQHHRQRPAAFAPAIRVNSSVVFTGSTK